MHYPFQERCIYLHTVLDRSSMKHRTFRLSKLRRSRTLHLYSHCSMPTYYCTYLSLRNTYYPFRVRCIYYHTKTNPLGTMLCTLPQNRSAHPYISHLHSHLCNYPLHHKSSCLSEDQRIDHHIQFVHRRTHLHTYHWNKEELPLRKPFPYNPC